MTSKGVHSKHTGPTKNAGGDFYVGGDAPPESSHYQEIPDDPNQRPTIVYLQKGMPVKDKDKEVTWTRGTVAKSVAIAAAVIVGMVLGSVGLFFALRTDPASPATTTPSPPNAAPPTRPSSPKAVTWLGPELNYAIACDFAYNPRNNLTSEWVPSKDCGGLCAGTPNCSHFTVTTGGPCWLMQGPIAKTDAFHTDDYQKTCGVIIETLPKVKNWQPGDFATGCVFEGNDLQHVDVPVNECGPACRKRFGCSHYTWAGGRCFMKKGRVGKHDALVSNDASKVCGLDISATAAEDDRWEAGNFAHGCDFRTKTFENSTVIPDHCGRDCRMKPGCTHYAWRIGPRPLGTCSMKMGAVARSDAVPIEDGSAICGIK